MSKYFKCVTNKNPVLYKCGEKVLFTVFAKEDGKSISCKRVRWKVEGDDGGVLSGETAITPDTPLTVECSLKRAGFAHLNCVALDERGEADKEFDLLDASAGADVLKLGYCDTLPDDFTEYWREIEKIVSDFPLDVVFYKPKENNVPNGFRAYEVRIKTPSGRPASGCVTVPLANQKYPIRISFLGYGIHAASYVYEADKICACFNAHGFENNKPEDELQRIYGEELSMYGFDNKENASNMTTYFRNMMIRNLIALKYVKTLPEWNKKDIISVGGSQGGLQATTLAAHADDVTELIIDRPWFCNLKAENCGFLKGWRPEFAEGLRYFDTVAQAMFVKCRVRIICHLGDYVCPPSTVMALYNSIKSDKTIHFVQSATHSYTPPEKEDVEHVFE